MTDISREAVERETSGLRFMHNSTCRENRLPPKECTTAYSRAANFILALRAALDAAEARERQAVDAEREACAAVADASGSQPSTGDDPHDAIWDRACVSIAAAIRTRGGE